MLSRIAECFLHVLIENQALLFTRTGSIIALSSAQVNYLTKHVIKMSK